MYEIEILELWDSKLIAIKEENKKEIIYNIDGFVITKYEKENKISIQIFFDNQEKCLSFAKLDNKIINFSCNCETGSFFGVACNKSEEFCNKALEKLKSWL